MMYTYKDCLQNRDNGVKQGYSEVLQGVGLAIVIGVLVFIACFL